MELQYKFFFWFQVGIKKNERREKEKERDRGSPSQAHPLRNSISVASRWFTALPEELFFVFVHLKKETKL
jgi:hypothetical protein